jgi:hypothetical protein
MVQGNLPRERGDSWNATAYTRVSGWRLAVATAEPSQRGRIMLYVRIASGSFINAATIVQLSPQRMGIGDEITGWVAICDGGDAVSVAPYYAAPGRIATVLDHVAASARNIGPVPSGADLACFSADCCA